MVDYYNHVKHCTTHPKFLHSNSTSHRWVFGAIAELIDNAIDPDVSASQFCIDMKEFNGEPCLVFMDNGSGLVPERLHKMLSFGHSKKQMTPGDRSIGKHGNGFKSGTMRLGKDVLVLTKCADSMTAGFLSQTFLADTSAEDILIPQVSWDRQGNILSTAASNVDLEVEESLRAICKYSIFPDEESLLVQLEAIPQTGAILIISNLRRHEGVLELDFETDPHDIRITSEITSTPHFQQLRPNQPNTTVVPMDYSLRAYVSILYKVPRMQIFIRDKKVKTKRIAGLLSQKETETYKPYGVAESIKIELGFNTENKNLYGMMLYHRNRLIKAYMRVGMQLEENERGMGVIGLAEADFLQPTHNKQDFDDTTAYRRLLKKLSDLLAEYWWEKKERVLEIQPETRRRGTAGVHSEDVPDTNWVQCDNPTCLKWRVLPPGTAVEKLPDIWYCEYHPDPKYRSHEEPEQEWDTSVQHEIIERRRERKREYDREKKEREAEKKRQRLEAATRDSVAELERQREELAKGIQEQLERERQALEEKKSREEEVKKLNEEWALIKEVCAQMESKREDLLKEQKSVEEQLTAAQEELAKEKQEFALLQARKEAEKVAQVEAERAAQIESEMATEREVEKEADKTRSDQQFEGRTLASEENGHGLESTIDDIIPHSKGRKRGGSKSRKGTPVKEKRGTRKGNASVLTTRLPHLLPEANQTPQTIEANGSQLANNSGPCRMSSAPPSSTAQRPKQVQAALPPRHRETSAPSREDVTRVSSGNQGQLQRNETNPLARTIDTNGSEGTSSGRSRKQGRAVHTSQTPLFEWGPTEDSPNQVQRTVAEEREPNGELPSTSSPRVQSSSPEPNRTVEAGALETTTESNQQTRAEVSHSSVDQRSTSASDPAYQRTVLSDDCGTGSLVSTGQQVPVTDTTDRENQQTAVPQADTSIRFAGLQGQPAVNVSGPGELCIDLPVDTSVFKSESIRTLDKEFYSSQRRLRLALNTLAKIGGLNDGRVYDLDQLPITDEEVIQLCEKTQENVEAKLTRYRQDVASLKAELAYLMADKYQNGQAQSWNFKIQSVINKWGVMEVSKKS